MISRLNFHQRVTELHLFSARSGHPEVWVCDSEGLNTIQVTSFGGAAVTTPRWSPDGQRIVFDSNASGEYDIWVADATGGKLQRLTTDPANDGNPSWSRNGRWIYFDSARKGGQQVWKIPAEGGDAVQVTRDGGFAPVESPDGTFLFFVKNLLRTSVWKIPTEGGEAKKVIDNLSSYINLAITEKGLFFIPRTRPNVLFSIQLLDFSTNEISTIANFHHPLSLGARAGLTVSPNGKWILYTQIEQAASELMLVDNFR
jgi:Tol biopolymer transport system component